MSDRESPLWRKVTIIDPGRNSLGIIPKSAVIDGIAGEFPVLSIAGGADEMLIVELKVPDTCIEIVDLGNGGHDLLICGVSCMASRWMAVRELTEGYSAVQIFPSELTFG